jgi:hypothetical protein
VSVPVSGKDTVEEGEYSSSDVSSGRPPVEVDVLHDVSELSGSGDRQRRFVAAASDISSMPPDSILDGPAVFMSPKKRSTRTVGEREIVEDNKLKAPARSRSVSKERIVAQRVVEKLKREHGSGLKESSKRRHGATVDRHSRSRSASNEHIVEGVKTSKSRSSKHRESSVERNLHPSEVSVLSSRSATSTTSINNPKLLSAVQDAIKDLLPEIAVLKEENKSLKSKLKFEETTRDSRTSTSSRSRDGRRVSKSSSLPNVSRSELSEERLVTEEGSGRRKSSRRSSRGSEKSYDTTVHEESLKRKSSRDKGGKNLKEGLAAAAAGMALGVLGAKALKHHGSSSSIDREKRRRSKSHSRSRTTSFSESRSEQVSRDDDTHNHVLPLSTQTHTRSETVGRDDSYHSSIPPLPMQSVLDSELTRESILSADTERPASRSSKREVTPTKLIREVSRGSPVPVVTMGSPRSFNEQYAEHDEHLEDHGDVYGSQHSPHNAKLGLAAAGLGAAVGAAAVAGAAHHRDKQQIHTPNRQFSPIHSEHSYFQEEVAEHPRVKSIRSDNSMSSERRRKKSASPVSPVASPSGIIQSRKRAGSLNPESTYEIDDEYNTETPRQDDLEQWLEREHAKNDKLRREFDHESLISDPDGYRDTIYTEDDTGPLRINTAQNVKSVGANPEYVSTPDAAQSAVASLQNPSFISVHSSTRSLGYDDRPISQADSYAMEQDEFTAPVVASLRPFSDSKQHWEEVRDRVMAMSNERGVASPAQSDTRSVDDKPVMHSSYIPVAGDMPDFSYTLPEEDDMQTNPSVIEGRLGEGIEMSPYPVPEDIREDDHHHLRDAALLGTAAGVGLGLAQAAKKSPDSTRQLDGSGVPRDLKDPVYTSSPAQNKDEGYISANPGPMSPEPHHTEDRDFGEQDLTFDDDLGIEDPFMTQKHLRHESGLSHGMGSPLYDNTTGKGIDRIQSKDVVALMDHLTVRDAQRNARDTEILVTLVRSAAEMRNSFEEMKRFIQEQERLLTNNMERAHESTVQRVLGGPRPIPSSSPRTRRSSEDTDDVPSKRRNIVKRALKGLSLRSTNDLAKIEDMLMHLLQEVEGLKTNQSLQRPSQPHTQTTSLNSYEHLRAAPDSGYEPEGRAGTNSSPAQSGHLSNNSSRYINGMHSGYDGRRGSEGHRISTVLEGDEDGDDGLRTPTGSKFATHDSTTPPTKELSRNLAMETPPKHSAEFSGERTPKTDKSKNKHKSFASSIFKSRWSKTTASSAPESVHNSASKKNRPYSTASRSGSDLQLNYEDYGMDENDRLRSHDSLGEDATMGASHNRAGSPLIPEEYDYDDPKYQAHRDSLNLQHPQPRAGPTHRHKTHLESQAMEYENPPTPDADQWGSAPALALNKSRFSNASSAARQSPVHSDDEYSEHSQEEDPHSVPVRQPRAHDDGPLIPPKMPVSNLEPSYGLYGVPLMNSGMHIASPLEPIEEVRKSLETDRSSVRHVSLSSTIYLALH